MSYEEILQTKQSPSHYDYFCLFIVLFVKIKPAVSRVAKLSKRANVLKLAGYRVIGKTDISTFLIQHEAFLSYCSSAVVASCVLIAKDMLILLCASRKYDVLLS